MMNIIYGSPFLVDISSFLARSFQIRRIALMLWIIFMPECGASFFIAEGFFMGILTLHDLENLFENIKIIKINIWNFF